MNFSFTHSRFHPHIGNDYFRIDPFGLKVLILGESHYRWPNMKELESQTTIEALESGRKRWHFWGEIGGKLGGAKLRNSPSVWDSVAFYNYIQDFVGDRPRVRPTDEMWTSVPSVEGFKEVLQLLKPNRVLVIGKTNWRMMAGGEAHFPGEAPIAENQFILPEMFCKNLWLEAEGIAYWYPTGDGDSALVAPIFHPAYPKGFHTSGTKEVIAKLLKRDWIPPNRKRNT